MLHCTAVRLLKSDSVHVRVPVWRKTSIVGLSPVYNAGLRFFKYFFVSPSQSILRFGFSCSGLHQQYSAGPCVCSLQSRFIVFCYAVHMHLQSTPLSHAFDFYFLHSTFLLRIYRIPVLYSGYIFAAANRCMCLLPPRLLAFFVVLLVCFVLFVMMRFVQ